MRAVPEITAMGILDHQTNERIPTNLLRQFEGTCFINSHERRFDQHFLIHPEPERAGHRLDCLVPAIGIARVIRFAHAGDEMRNAAAVSERARESEKNQVAARHEGRWQTVFANFDFDFARERRIGNGGERVQPDHMILAEPGFPFRLDREDLRADFRPHVELDAVALAVIEADRFHARETIERPGETNGGILPAGKQNKRSRGLGHYIPCKNLSRSARRAVSRNWQAAVIGTDIEPWILYQ